MRRSKLLVDVDKLDYGPATANIKNMLTTAAGISWFPQIHKKQQRITVDNILQDHFHVMEEITQKEFSASVEICYIDHDWLRLSHVRDTLTYDEELPKWKEHIWLILHKKQQASVSDLTKRQLIRPPVWCFHGQLGIVNPLIADRSVIPSHIKSEFVDLAWDLVCDVEHVLHRAISWEIFCSPNENPLSMLLPAYAAQGFPLGFDKARRFWVFLA